MHTNQPPAGTQIQTSDLTALLADDRKQIDTYLRQYWDRQVLRAGSMSPGYLRLTNVVSNLIYKGGKRMRPYLTVLAYRLYGGQDIAGMIPIAVAQELLHLSMLIHDDIIDRDTIRYGIDSVNGAYEKNYVSMGQDATHFAASAAIMGGDLVLSFAHAIIYESSLSADQKLIALQLISQSVFDVIGGELLDFEAILAPISEIDTIAVATFKTASYSFIGPLLTGAKLAGASVGDLAALRDYGLNTAVAFQLADDLLGVFGDEKKTGKSTSSDIEEGKRTYLMQQAFAAADTDQKVRLEAVFGHPDITPKQAEEVRHIITATGAKSVTEKAIAKYGLRASKTLDRLSLSAAHKQPLQDLIAQISIRDK